MMKKPLAILSMAILGAFPPATRLVDLYRAGPVVVRADEDWTANLPPDLFFESRGDIAVAPDGSVFVSNTSRHTIYKFDPKGRFVKRFGQKGQGPGDLTFPGRLSILDGQYLVVGEYATNQRLSLFDLDGNLVKLLGTGRFTSQAIALGDGKIAYVSIKGRLEPDEMVKRCEVLTIDWRSGAQRSVVAHEIRMPIARFGAGGIISSGNTGVLLAPTSEGGLVVGRTDKAELEVFTADGAKVRTIDTGWKPVPVTAQYRDRYRALQHERAAAEGRKPPANEPPFPDFLNVLQDIWADDEGNILVCRNTDCLEGCPLQFKVYAPAGAFISDFELRPGLFALAADHQFRRIVVSGRGLYGLLELGADPDGFLHLIRMALGPR
jgi:hypothetical protein